MAPAVSLVIDSGGGEQIVRRPRPTDAIGTTLRNMFDGTGIVPADMRELLAKIDRATKPLH